MEGKIKKFDILIVGGGLAGLTMAVALSSSRYQIALIEQNQEINFEDKRVYALSLATRNLLQKIRIWDNISQDQITAVHAMQIYGDQGANLEFCAQEQQLDALNYIVPATALLHELRETAKRQHNLTFFMPDALDTLNITDESVNILTQQGHQLHASLVIGADGRTSKVRTLCNIEAQCHDYQQRGIVASITTEKCHHHTAYQWFNQGEILAFLPMDKQNMSIVWSVETQYAQELLALSEAQFCLKLQQTSGSLLGNIALASKRQSFPLSLLKVPHVVIARVALIGDAAHGLHPLTGHGINLGFSDVEALAGVLNPLASWQDPGQYSVLKQYERACAEQLLLLRTVTHGVYYLFSQTGVLQQSFRHLGMKCLNRLPFIKNKLIAYATLGHF